MLNVFVNDKKIQIPAQSTVLQACQNLGINVPKFCFHEKLKIAGNCRMCLVEVKNSPKPVVSCSMPVVEGMNIYTDTPLVKKTRETILEFLLINHPLDCPVCDQGGECDLQDQTISYGSDRSRFFFNKRSVENKNCGIFVKTIMTRCIHCTRCVRFTEEVCDTDELGTTGRGKQTEISFYLSKVFNSEFSANVIDLCPVGALTSKPFSFKVRSWELKEKVTLDLFDPLNLKIIIQTFNNKIIRILPRINNILNMEWINNKTRFFFDANNYQRIEYPLIKSKGGFKRISWEEAFRILYVKNKSIDSTNKMAIVGNFLGLEDLFNFKKFTSLLGLSSLIHENILQNSFNYSTSVNKNLLVYDDVLNSDLCLVIGCNLRTDYSLLNLKLKELSKKNNLKIYSIGPRLNSTYAIKNLGLSLEVLVHIIKGKHSFCKKMLAARSCTILVDSNIYGFGASNLFSYFEKLFKVNVLLTGTGLLNFFEIVGISKVKKKHNKLFILYNTDIVKREIFNKTDFSIYFGHHFNNDAQASDLILPSLTFLEKSVSFLNIFGNIQKTSLILKKRNQSKNDFVLFECLFSCFKKNIFLTPRICFNKLFVFFQSQSNLIQVQKKQTTNKKGYSKLPSFFKPFYVSRDIFQPQNIFEKNSKILATSFAKFVKKN